MLTSKGDQKVRTVAERAHELWGQDYTVRCLMFADGDISVSAFHTKEYTGNTVIREQLILYDGELHYAEEEQLSSGLYQNTLISEKI